MVKKKSKNIVYSLVIPVLNECSNLHKLVMEISRSLKKISSYEIIIVDDGSTDETKLIVSEIIKVLSDITIIFVEHEKRYGQSAGLLSGIKASNGNIIITLDGDGQNDPSDIVKMLSVRKSIRYNDLIIGNRVNRNDVFSKRFASRAAFFIRKIILKDNTPDTGCGLKVFNKNFFLELPYFNHIHRFLPFLFKVYGGRVLSVEVNHRPRDRGASNYSNFQRFRVGLLDILGVKWLASRSPFPIFIKNKHNKTVKKR